MQGLSRADHRTLRTAVIEQVLGTDMKKHFNILSRFQVSPHTLSDLTTMHSGLCISLALMSNSVRISSLAFTIRWNQWIKVRFFALLRKQVKLAPFAFVCLPPPGLFQ